MISRLYRGGGGGALEIGQVWNYILIVLGLYTATKKIYI